MVAVSSPAIEQIDWESSTLQGEGWQIGDLQVALTFNEAGQLQFSAQAKQLELPKLKLQDIKLSCVNFQFASKIVSCPKGLLEFFQQSAKKYFHTGQFSL